MIKAFEISSRNFHTSLDTMKKDPIVEYAKNTNVLKFLLFTKKMSILSGF